MSAVSPIPLAERDEQLVALLRADKGAFLQEYRRILQVPDDVSLTGMLDREMIRAILDREFPQRTQRTNGVSHPAAE